MTGNGFGHNFRITTFGESHGPALGVVIEGVPSGLQIDDVLLRQMLDRRRPGTSHAVSGRQEFDQYEILSGTFEGKALGTPIAVIIRNQDPRSTDYDEIKNNPRPGHADQAWKDKFIHVDHRGGGRASGRETVSRVIGGAFARMYLQQEIPKLQVRSLPRQIGPLVQTDAMIDFSSRYGLSPARWKEVTEFLTQAKTEGQSYGGIAEIWIDGLPAGLGEPVFYKLKSALAGALMSIGATQGFEIDDGFQMALRKGTDAFATKSGDSGGISTGERLRVKVAFKPSSSVLDVAKKGRHDPCVLLRALVVAESMVWLVLADLWSVRKAQLPIHKN